MAKTNTIFNKETIEKSKTQIMTSFAGLKGIVEKGIKDIVEKESPKNSQEISPKQLKRLEN